MAMRVIPESKKLLAGFSAYLLLENGAAENSIQAYLRDAQRLLDFLAPRPLDEVGVGELHDFMVAMVDLGLAPRSLRRLVSGIRALFRYLVDENFLENNPALLLEPPQIGLSLPTVLSVQEIDSMIAAIDPDSAQALRDRALMETLYGCGLRVSELINLQVSRLNLKEGYLSVIGKGNKERLVPMSLHTADVLDEWLADRADGKIATGEENFVFLSPRTGRHLTRMRIFDIVRELARRAGIARDVSPHTLRHSFASHLLEGGANLRAIQQMLGHESIATTQIYIHLDRSHLRREILEHHPRNNRV